MKVKLPSFGCFPPYLLDRELGVPQIQQWWSLLSIRELAV
jgi:hypothetical protein